MPLSISYISVRDKKIHYYDDKTEGEIAANGLKDDIEYVLFNLGYTTIRGDDEYIVFDKPGSSHHFSGLYYIKNNIAPESDLSSCYYEKIKDHWFFYYENPT